MSDHVLSTERSRLRRAPARGSFDRAVIDAILDASFTAHLGTIMTGADGLNPWPQVTPVSHWRVGDYVYWHASTQSRSALAAVGQAVCLTVTLLDGLVMARSAYHHSVNFRSVMLFGLPELVEGEEARLEAARALIERLSPQRWAEVRPPTAKEMKVTAFLRLKIAEGAAKIRTGPPKDEAEDMALPVWAGVVPVETRLGTPIPDPALAEGIAVPDYFRRIKVG